LNRGLELQLWNPGALSGYETHITFTQEALHQSGVVRSSAFLHSIEIKR
jgi:hypothetical protein